MQQLQLCCRLISTFINIIQIMLENVARWSRPSATFSTEGHHIWLSYDQLWAASLIGRNAVTWRWALSYYVHRFTVTRCDIIMSHMWNYNVTRRDVTWCSLNANVRYILRCFCLRLVCFCFVFWRLTVSFFMKYSLNLLISAILQ